MQRPSLDRPAVEGEASPDARIDLRLWLFQLQNFIQCGTHGPRFIALRCCFILTVSQCVVKAEGMLSGREGHRKLNLGLLWEHPQRDFLFGWFRTEASLSLQHEQFKEAVEQLL